MSRQVHKFELFMSMMNVSALFRTRTDSALTQRDVQRSLVQLSTQHPILRHTIHTDGNHSSTLVHAEGELCTLFSGEGFLSWREYDVDAPSTERLTETLVLVTRETTDVSATLFKMHVHKYRNETIFYLVVNHAITDGPSLFAMIDSFLNYLSTSDSTSSDEDFQAVAAAQQVAPPRDLLAELAADPRTLDTNRDFVNAAYAPDNDMLTFPKLTPENADYATGGRINACFAEIDETTTNAILVQCKAHGVSFQSLLSALSSVAFYQLVAPSTADAATRPIYHFCPVNMRRYLQGADSITSCMGGNVWLRQAPLGTEDTFLATNVWDIATSLQKRIKECVDSAVPFQWLHEMQSGNFFTPHSMVSSSMGVVPLKRHYGHLQLLDLVFEAGVYAASEDAHSHPVIPEGRGGYGMLHAYTLFGALRLTGSYYAYKESYIRQYFDCIERMLRTIGCVDILSDLVVAELLQK